MPYTCTYARAPLQPHVRINRIIEKSRKCVAYAASVYCRRLIKSSYFTHALRVSHTYTHSVNQVTRAVEIFFFLFFFPVVNKKLASQTLYLQSHVLHYTLYTAAKIIAHKRGAIECHTTIRFVVYICSIDDLSVSQFLFLYECAIPSIAVQQQAIDSNTDEYSTCST